MPKYIVVILDLEYVQDNPEFADSDEEPLPVVQSITLCKDKDAVASVICGKNVEWNVWEILPDGKTAQRSVIFSDGGKSIASIQ